MVAPHIAQGMPANESWFADQLRSLQRQITELRAAQTLNAATVGTGGLASSNFDGTLNPPAVGTQGWGMAGGPAGAVIVGTLIVRDGIIGDDALTNPIAVDRYDGTTTGITLTTTNAVRTSGTIAVPDGFTQALVMAFAQVGGNNTFGAADGVHCDAQIAGVSGDDVVESVANNTTGHSVSMFTHLVPGLTGGGTITVAAEGRTAVNSWTGATARVSATALFLR